MINTQHALTGHYLEMKSQFMWHVESQLTGPVVPIHHQALKHWTDMRSREPKMLSEWQEKRRTPAPRNCTRHHGDRATASRKRWFARPKTRTLSHLKASVATPLSPASHQRTTDVVFSSDQYERAAMDPSTRFTSSCLYQNRQCSRYIRYEIGYYYWDLGLAERGRISIVFSFAAF